MYDKQVKRLACVPIKAVAQEKGYYTDEDERRLNDLIEGPANPVLQRLRCGQRLEEGDREKLVSYIGTMLMRGPWRRQRSEALAPDVADKTMAEFEANLTTLAASSPDQELAMRHLAEFQRIKADVLADPSSWIQDFVREPWASERVLSVIGKMTWRIATTTGQERFLTSDTPVWFETGRGMNKVDSEITFPLASDLALYASWQGPPARTFYDRVRPVIVRELNRRIASRAVRFVFFHARAVWLPSVAEKRPQLNRILWN